MRNRPAPANQPANQYEKRYAAFGMERHSLFEFIQKAYHPKTVLYPGCSIHLTPAFYFPHVVFVDQAPEAADFFSDPASLLAFVSRHRRYRRAPHLQFIAQDFTQPLPVPLNQFDLVLALYAGGIARACRPYLRLGGWLITNDHQGDAREAAQDHELALTAILQYQQGRYRLNVQQPGEPVEFKSQTRRSKLVSRRTGSGVEYVENERYYIFTRSRPR